VAATEAVNEERRRWPDRLRAWGRVDADQPLLPVVRRAFLVFLLSCYGMTVLRWLSDPVVPHGRSWPVLPVLAALSLAAVRLYRKEHPHPVTDLLVAVGVGVVIWAVGALPAGGVLFVGASFRAMYGRFPSTVAFSVMVLTAMAGGVIVAGGTVADTKLEQYGPGLILTTLMLRLVLLAVQRYETGAAARFETVVRSSRDVIMITDRDTAACYVSPALERVFGLAPDALPDGRFLSWVLDEDREHVERCVARLLAEPQAASTFGCRVPTGDGGTTHVEISAQNLLEDPHVHGLLLAVRDVSERTELTERLRHQAYHDPLTGLANRTLLTERLATARAGGVPGAALLLTDLDSFKAVNDTLGHLAGDELLVEVAARLSRRLAPADLLVRLGGDEFAILLLGERAAPHTVEQIAEDLLATFDLPIALSGVQRTVSASIGIAIANGPVDGERLLREADIALYRAKGGGRARYVQYRQELHGHAVEQLQLQLDLHQALSRREFVLHYQPIHDLGTGRRVGFEALVRWHRPERGTIGPEEFVPLAEHTGAIVPLGGWILLEACRQGAALFHLTGEPLQVNVNVSVRQFLLGSVVGHVRRALERSGLPPSRLTVEITESTLATDDDTIEVQLRTLRALGVRISLDDFGTGYSSLGYLHRYPVDELKIDRSFVERLGSERGTSEPVVSAVMALSRSLGLRTVAEGIETDVQRSRLALLGCDLGQGFGLTRPVTADGLRSLLLSGSDASRR